MAPIWHDLAKRVEDVANLYIGMVDCTNNAELCMNQQINAYPTLILFKNSVKHAEYSGARDLDSLHNFLAGHLKHEEL